jgi:hypothetical protein
VDSCWAEPVPADACACIAGWATSRGSSSAAAAVAWVLAWSLPSRARPDSSVARSAQQQRRH